MTATGQISFGPSQLLSDTVPTPLDVQAFDLDQDGDLDVVSFTDVSPVVYWWLNDGMGNFGKRSEMALHRDFSGIIKGLDDFNEDGFLDILHEAAESYDLMISWGEAGIVFSSPQNIDSSSADFQIYLHDFDFTNPFGESFYDFDNNGIKDHIVSDTDKIILTKLFTDQPSTQETIYTVPTDEKAFSAIFFPRDQEGQSHRLVVISTLELESIIRILTFNEGTVPMVSTELRVPRIDADYTYNDFRYLSTTQDPTTSDIFFVTPHADGFEDQPLFDYYRISQDGISGAIDLVYTADKNTYFSAPLITDLDGDSIEDLLLPFSSIPFEEGPFIDQIAWAKGSSSGTFSEDYLPISTAGHSHDIQHIGDVDGDGDEDLITQATFFLDNQTDPAPLLLWEMDTAEGELVSKTISNPLSRRSTVIAAEDLSGVLPWAPQVGGETIDWPEDRTDFLLQSINVIDDQIHHFLEWLLQDSKGNFHSVPLPVTTTIVSGPYPPRVDFQYLDWDRDGEKDLLKYNSSPSLFKLQESISWQKGASRSFLEEAPIFHGATPLFFADKDPHFVDYNQDGIMDIIGLGRLVGDPQAEDPISYLIQYNDLVSPGSFEPLSSEIYEIALDLDQDGSVDFVTILNGEPTGILSSDGSRISLGDIPIDRLNNLLSTSQLIDIDNDGDLDIVESQKNNIFIQSLIWIENGGSPNALDLRVYPITPSRIASRSKFSLIDMDQDGTKDLLSISKGLGTRIEWFKITNSESPSAFSNWMIEQELKGHSAGISSDYDQDGHSNWEEFAFGSNPALRETNSASVPGVRTGESGPEFSFLFRSDADALGLTHSHIRSVDLVNWAPMGEAPTVTPAQEGYERISYPVNPESSREFFKTVISPPPE